MPEQMILLVRFIKGVVKLEYGPLEDGTDGTIKNVVQECGAQEGGAQEGGAQEGVVRIDVGLRDVAIQEGNVPENILANVESHAAAVLEDTVEEADFPYAVVTRNY